MGISKLHQLYVLECECLQAVVPLPTGRFTRLSIRPKLLADLVMQNFQTSQEELTVTCQPRPAYCDNGVPAAGSVQTSLSLRPDEFHEYRPSGSKGVTFCQRELRCLLMFGDWQAPASFPLEIEFERPGRPVQFHYAARRWLLKAATCCPPWPSLSRPPRPAAAPGRSRTPSPS
uniref:Arrestin_N domain-containing protein n=1 Tax=Macrostomum lignano TaxID=282301 RepID=A0A1I8F4A0_9PLAT